MLLDSSFLLLRSNAIVPFVAMPLFLVAWCEKKQKPADCIHSSAAMSLNGDLPALKKPKVLGQRGSAHPEQRPSHRHLTSPSDQPEQGAKPNGLPYWHT